MLFAARDRRTGGDRRRREGEPAAASMVALGVLAGGFIGLGAMFATLVSSDSGLDFAVARVLAAWSFPSD